MITTASLGFYTPIAHIARLLARKMHWQRYWCHFARVLRLLLGEDSSPALVGWTSALTLCLMLLVGSAHTLSWRIGLFGLGVGLCLWQLNRLDATPHTEECSTAR